MWYKNHVRHVPLMNEKWHSHLHQNDNGQNCTPQTAKHPCSPFSRHCVWGPKGDLSGGYPNLHTHVVLSAIFPNTSGE